MNPSNTSDVLTLAEPGGQVPEIHIEEIVRQVYESAQPAVRSHMLAQLVGKVYETAPPALRGPLLEQLLRPLGVLSLVAVANGIFAKIRFRSGWPDMHVRMEDAQSVRTSDVIVLVDHVQQVSVEALDGLAQLLAAAPVMASSAAAAVLMTVLLQRARTRRTDDNQLGFSSATPK